MPQNSKNKKNSKLEFLKEFIARTENQSLDNTANLSSIKKLQEDFSNFNIEESSISDNELFSFAKKIIKSSVDTNSPNFHNQLFAGIDKIALSGDFLTSFLNLTMATYEMSSVATLMEKKLIEIIADKSGFKNAEGIFTSGASYANIAALLCARHKINPKLKTEGLDGKKYLIFTSEDSHYSFSKAANLIGIGLDNVIKIKADNNGKISIAALEEKIEFFKNKGENYVPLVIAATVGTTVRGAFDDLSPLSEVAQKHNIWLHADGAYGGIMIFHKDKKDQYLANLEKVDSFAIDFHKALGSGLLSSAIVLNGKEKGFLSEVFNNDSGGYLFHNDAEADYDLGTMSLQCGRRADAIKAFLMLKYYGFNEISNKIENLLNLADYARKKVRSMKNFELLFEQDKFLSVCFRYNPKLTDLAEINEINNKLRKNLITDGEFMVNQAILNGTRFIRLVIVNHSTEFSDLDKMFTKIQELSANIKF